MKKLIVSLVILVIAFPFLAKLIPDPMGIERVRAAFEEAGYEVENFDALDTPGREAIAQWVLTVTEYRVEVYEYDSEGKIAKHLGYLAEDPGASLVSSMGIAESLGAAPDPNLPSVALRKGKWMVQVVGPDRGRCQTLANIFRKS